MSLSFYGDGYRGREKQNQGLSLSCPTSYCIGSSRGMIFILMSKGENRMIRPVFQGDFYLPFHQHHVFTSMPLIKSAHPPPSLHCLHVNLSICPYMGGLMDNVQISFRQDNWMIIQTFPVAYALVENGEFGTGFPPYFTSILYSPTSAGVKTALCVPSSLSITLTLQGVPSGP